MIGKIRIKIPPYQVMLALHETIETLGNDTQRFADRDRLAILSIADYLASAIQAVETSARMRAIFQKPPAEPLISPPARDPAPAAPEPGQRKTTEDIRTEQIIDYVSSNPGCYISEIAEAIDHRYNSTSAIVKRLRDEGILFHQGKMPRRHYKMTVHDQ